jgi:SAM-dependent methyltransferase
MESNLDQQRAEFQRRYSMAEELAAQGDYDAALSEYDKLLRDADRIGPVLLAQIHNDLGFINFIAGQIDEARSDFSRALGVDPFCKEAHENCRRLDELVHGHLSDGEVEDYLRGFYGADASAMDYIMVHLRRFTDTLNFLPRAAEGMRLLELGANTLFSPLLRRFTAYQVSHGDYWVGDETQRQLQLVSNDGSETLGMDVLNFDAEKDPFPFPDATFDVVLACEIIEHLPNDPMHTLIECNRVLKPGGRVVLTTPNITSYRSLNGILNGYPPYIYNKFSSNNGGRHVKEYAPREFEMILPKAGFAVEALETRNVWVDAEPGVSYWSMYRSMHNILKSLGSPLRLRGEDIFVSGVKRGEPLERYPVEFYD